jgi:hypothetical protein
MGASGGGVMGRLRLADALTDFGSIRIGIVAEEPQEPAAVPRPAAPEPAPVPFDPTDLIADAVRRAEDALAARLREEHAAEIGALREHHAGEMADALQKLGAETGAAIAASLTTAEERILKLTSDAVARLIGPVLADDVTRRSIDGLAQAIRESLAERDAIRIRVRGPRPLFEGLSLALGDRAADAQFEEQAGFDLSVSVGDMLYETRLGEWSASLAEALR